MAMKGNLRGKIIMPDINWIAVIVATVAGFVLGGLWYGPIFGKIWRREAGEACEKKKSMAMLLGITILVTFISAVVFGAFLGPHPALGLGIGAGLSTGLVWVGGSMGIAYMYGGRSITQILIDCGFPTVQFTLFGLIFALLG